MPGVCGWRGGRHGPGSEWWLNYYVIQVVTGHGDFREKLMGFGLSESDRCECGEVDNAWHLVSECPLTRADRVELVGFMRDRGYEFQRGNIFRCRQVADFFMTKVTKMMKEREERRSEEIHEVGA